MGPAPEWRPGPCASGPARHESPIAAPAAQPDPRVGPPGPHRRLDRPPARGDGPADPVLQARERARGRRRRHPRPSRRSTSAPRTTPPSPPSSRPRRPAVPRRRRSWPRRPPSAPPTRTPSRPKRTTVKKKRKPAQARPPRRPHPPPRGRHGPVRGHLRPRRGGLRAVARPRRRGQPDLRRALGGPPAGRGHDRGGPDRHPSRQWR